MIRRDLLRNIAVGIPGMLIGNRLTSNAFTSRPARTTGPPFQRATRRTVDRSGIPDHVIGEEWVRGKVSGGESTPQRPRAIRYKVA